MPSNVPAAKRVEGLWPLNNVPKALSVMPEANIRLRRRGRGATGGGFPGDGLTAGVGLT